MGKSYHLYSNEFTFTEVGAISSKTYDCDISLTRWEITDNLGNIVFSTLGNATCELQPGTYQVHIYKTIGECYNTAGYVSENCNMQFYLLGGSEDYPITEVYDSTIVNGVSKQFSLYLAKDDLMHIAYTFPGMTWTSDCYPDCTITITNSSGTTVSTYTYEGSADNAYQQICFTAPATDSYTVNMEVISSYDFCWTTANKKYDWPLLVSAPVQVAVNPSPSTKSIQVGQQFTITPNATEGATITYLSSKTNVCTVSTNGVVTGKSKGNSIITVTASK